MSIMRVSVDRLREGMIIANEVYSQTGIPLVTEGTPVTKEVINLLTKHFIDEVRVSYEEERKIAARPRRYGMGLATAPKYEEWKEEYQVAENVISESLKQIISGTNGVDSETILDTLNGILEKSGTEGDFFSMILKMKNSSSSLYTHAVNVALMAQLLAQWVRCSDEEIEVVTLAGVLHDVGHLELSKTQMETFSYVKELETNEYERHVISGYNLLKKQKVNQDVLQAILTHHESLDGRGYPLKVTQENIRQTSRILAIADTFDTLTMRTPGEENLSAFAALKRMQDWGIHKFDTQILMEFTTHIAESMIQREVRLSDGRVGQIVMLNRFNIFSPMVKTGDDFVDLSKRHNLEIVELL